MGLFQRIFKREKRQSSQQAEGAVYPQLPAFQTLGDVTVDISKISSNSNEGIANASPVSSIKRIKSRVLSYRGADSKGSQFLEPEYNLAEIGVVLDVESFVRQAVNKKVALMFKEGFDFIGKNPKTINYLNIRLAHIARASGKSTSALLRDIGTSLITTSNAFLVKVRDPKASGGKLRVSPEGKLLKPVAAYFIAPPETMRVKLDKYGNILGWRQEMPDNDTYKDFSKEDVIHFYIRRREGFIFGTPDLIPVLDDIRALRKMEETLELVVHKHAFPLFQYIVGTPEQPAGVTEDGRDEIEVAKTEIEYMPAEGCIVTPERHKIEAVGAEGKALKAEGLLAYFKLRVIAGLGISEIDLGQGDTANRGTARQLSRQLIDGVKDIQDILEEQFGEQIISELLLESTFNFDMLDIPNIVKLQFREIDIENRIEQEKHASEMFKANGLTFSEFRSVLGKEPILIPEDPHDQDPTKYPEWHNLYWKLFGEPELLIKAIDEAWTPQAIAASEARSLSLTSKEMDASKTAQADVEKTKAEEDRKTKIAVMKAKPKPSPSKKKDFIIDFFDLMVEKQPQTNLKILEKDIVAAIMNELQNPTGIDRKRFFQEVRLALLGWQGLVQNSLISSASNTFIAAFDNASGHRAHEAYTLLATGRKDIERHIKYYLDKFVDDLYARLAKVVNVEAEHKVFDTTKKQNLFIAEVRNVFTALRYRVKFIINTETAKSESYGKLLGMRYNGTKRVVFEGSSDACEKCQVHIGQVIHIDEITLNNIVPVHPECRCFLKAIVD